MKPIVSFLLVFLSLQLIAQKAPTYLDIGDVIPNISFSNIVNHNTDKISINDFKGKLLIVDFWATWCSPCVSSLPRLNALQEKFSQKIQILLVSNESRNTITKFFEKVKKQRTYNLPIITDDTILNKLFKHSSLPHTIIIDPNGVVRYEPNYKDVNDQTISAILANEKVHLAANYNKIERKPLDVRKPFLIDGNGGNDPTLLYHSILTPFSEGLPFITSMGSYKDTVVGGRIIVTNNSIPFLYLLSYGSFKIVNSKLSYPPLNRLIIEVTDSSRFIQPKHGDIMKWRKENLYCYELIVPPNLTDRAHKILRSELDMLFGYDVTMEKRKVKCLVFKSLGDSSLFKAKDSTNDFDINTYYIKMRNTPLSELIYYLEHKFLAWTKKPIIDETGLKSNIDLVVDTKIDEPQLLAKALREHGLDLIEEERILDMVIFRDRRISDIK